MMKHSKQQPRSGKGGIPRAYVGIIIGLIFTFFAWQAGVATSTHLPDSGAPIEIHASENGNDLRNLFLSAIGSAETSISLAVYTLTDNTIIRALAEKARQGVKVEVIVDAEASPHAAERLGAGVKTVRRMGKGLMHCKILIVDKQRIMIGSANMTAESLQLHSNLVLAIHSPSLANYLLRKTGAITELSGGAPLSRENFQVGGQQMEFCFLPDEAKYALEKVKQQIRSAQKTIHVAMFTWTRNDFAHEIIRAAKRGVDVRVVIDRNSGKGASAKIVQLLKGNGIDVRLNRGAGLLHHKFMQVDGAALVTGSANWTKAAFSKNEECLIILSPLTATQQESLKDEWAILYADSEAA